VHLALKHRGRIRLASPTVLWLLVGSAALLAVSGTSHRVDGFQEGGQYASTVIGQPDFTSNTTDIVAGNALYFPFRPAFDQSGDMWVADENQHRVLEFKPPFTDGMNASIVIGQKNFTAEFNETTQSGLSTPVAVAFDGSGDLWVADYANNRVLEFKPPFTDGMNASIEIGQPAGSSQFTNGASNEPAIGFYAPLDMAFDQSGNLWIADRIHNRVLEFKPPFTDGMNASIVVGQPDIASSAASTSQAGLNAPESIAFDASGNLWVVDEDNNRILEFASASLAQDRPPATLEIGQPPGANQFNTSAGALTRSGLHAPVGLAFDAAGDLWASDRINNRVLEFKPPFTDGMNASIEIGQPAGSSEFTSNTAETSQDGLSNPLGVAFDSAGNLWVADQVNSRIVEFEGPATMTAGTDVGLPNGTGMADQTTLTGAKVEITGATAGSAANVYTAVWGSLPNTTSTPGISALALYDVKISGPVEGDARLCISNPSVDASTQMRYFFGGSWNSAMAVDSTAGQSVCGVIPLSALSGSLIVLGDTKAGMTPLEAQSILVALGIILAGSLTVATIRKRKRTRSAGDSAFRQ